MSGAFAVVTQITPIPDEWKHFVISLAWIVLVFSCFGWLGAHIDGLGRLRSSTKALHPMILFLIFCLSGALGLLVWWMVP